MVDHLQSRPMPWPQYTSHVKVRGTSSKMDVQGRTGRAFSSNSVVFSRMEMTVVTQYVLTATQSFGSQDYCKKSRKTILGLAGVFYENEQA